MRYLTKFLWNFDWKCDHLSWRVLIIPTTKKRDWEIHKFPSIHITHIVQLLTLSYVYSIRTFSLLFLFYPLCRGLGTSTLILHSVYYFLFYRLQVESFTQMLNEIKSKKVRIIFIINSCMSWVSGSMKYN